MDCEVKSILTVSMYFKGTLPKFDKVLNSLTASYTCFIVDVLTLNTVLDQF